MIAAGPLSGIVSAIVSDRKGWLADVRRVVWLGKPEPFFPMILVDHIPVYVPAIRVLGEAGLANEPLCSGLRTFFRSIDTDQLSIAAVLVIGADVVENENGFHAAGMRRRANVRYWARAAIHNVPSC